MIAVTATLSAVGSVANSAVDRLGAAWVAVQPGDHDPSSGHGPDWGKAAPAGLLIWLFLGTALFFLVKSMNRHMKRVPKSFDADSTPDSSAEVTQSSPVADGEPGVATGGDAIGGSASDGADPLPGPAESPEVGDARSAAAER